MTLAVLCPGQGGQQAGMFELVEREDQARPLIERAKECAGFDVVAASAGAAMFENEVAQPLICAYQGIVWSILESRLAVAGVSASYTAGYSVGELASHGCAGRLSWADTIALARERAAAMSAAGGDDDGLVSVRGLTRTGIEALLAGTRVFVAIVNGDDQFIVGGSSPALSSLAASAESQGAVVQRLQVSVAAHTPLLAGAVEPFRTALMRRAWKPMALPTLVGIDGSLAREGAVAVDGLARQVAGTIRWSACMDTLVERGVKVGLELGPGNALSRMLRDRHPGMEVRSVADFRSIDAVVDWVVRASR